MNITKEQNQLKTIDFNVVEEVDDSKISAAIADLEKKLENQADKFNHERFLYFFGIIMLINAAVFPHFNWAAAIGLMLMEIIFLSILAFYFGINYFHVMLDKCFYVYLNRNKSHDHNK